MQTFDIAVVGLAVMGRNLALNFADRGLRVAVYNRSRAVTEAFVRDQPRENVAAFYDLKALARALPKPRKLLLMIQAGAAVDAVLEQLSPLLEAGDIVLDGGNSFFEDTRRRSEALAAQGLYYFGLGVSGGETGARFGPSLMPGGDAAAYEKIRPQLEAIAARADGAPCCAYIGPDGAGHYVKMAHNGIEYADMQLIAEAYLLLKHVGGFSNAALADRFARWNESELESYLIGITAKIFREPDDLSDGALVDRIEDSASQKGTGRWTSIEALRQGVDVSMITAATNARVLSGRLAERAQTARQIEAPPAARAADPEAFAETVCRALYAAKIAAYAQGFSLLADASERYGWALDLSRIASIWRAGCIIQARFLSDIARAFSAQSAPSSLLRAPLFGERLARDQAELRAAVRAGIESGLPLPAMSSAIAYLDASRAPHVGANLIQAQRDYFGAHTYRRTDRPGDFHHEWGRKA